MTRSSFATTFALPLLTVAVLASSCEKTETTSPEEPSNPTEEPSSAEEGSESTAAETRSLKLADDSAFESAEQHPGVSSTQAGDLLFINDHDKRFRLLIDDEEIGNQTYRHVLVRGLAPGEYEFGFAFLGGDAQSVKVTVVPDAVGGRRVGRWQSVGMAVQDDFVTLDGNEEPPADTDLVVVAPKSANAPAAAATGLGVGQSAPSLKLPGMTGGEIDTGSFAGKVVVITFWGSWSKPALALLDELQELHVAHESKGLAVVGVNIDDARAKGQASTLVRGRAYGFANAFDTNGAKLGEWAGSDEVPFVVVVDRQGVVQYMGDGADIAAVIDGQL